ncbi:MAG: hypothetical protein GXO86_00020 [Chlorobi bacterium]|nr:hypothetical protein [Chlorobiota bacterium]
MIKLIFTLIVIFGLSQKVVAVYDVDENCKNAWMLLMDLKINEAKQLLADEIRINPENYYAYYLDQTCDAYRMIINSNDEDYKAFVENYEKKREIMDNKDTDSPYYLSCYSEMQIQLGFFNIMHGEQYSGVMKMYSAYRKVYRNLDKHPDFKPSLKLDGFFNVAMSTLPPFVQWVVSFFGVSSDINYGFKLLNENYQSQKNIKGINAESALFVILSAKINKTPEMVYDFTHSLDSSVSHTFIHQYFKANIAYRTGRNEEALTVLNQIDAKSHGSAGIIYNYLMGKILLRKLDPQAGYYLSQYLEHLEKKEYVKEINYSLALYYLLNNDPEKYLEYCEIVRDKGMDLNERDREALYDAKLDYIPDVNLVKARLSLDGGYIDQFEAAIKEYEANPGNLLAYEIEYLFLKARFDALGTNEKRAIAEFNKVIELGEDEDYYFASEAALRLGNIYNNKGEKELAKAYYEKAIKLYRSNYYEYIEDKAKKALGRL